MKKMILRVLIIALLILALGSTLHAAVPGDCDYLGQQPPGEEPVVFAPGIVSTKAMEYRLVVSPTGKEILFTRVGTIYLITKKEDGSGWSQPAPAPFSGKYVDGESCFSPDGKRVYWGSRRPLPGAKVPLNIWVSEKTAAGGVNLFTWETR